MGLIERRIGLLFAVFFALLVLAGARAGWLGLVQASELESLARGQQQKKLTIPAKRGTITDVRGVELAVSQPAVTIEATPYLIKDPARAATRLAPILRLPEDELARSFSRRDTKFLYVARRVPATRARQAQKLVAAMRLDGLDFVPEFQRDYPRSWMASQLLGNVGAEGHGLEGLEYQLDRHLSGVDGRRHLVKDARGDAIELRETRRTKRGADVRLTLDAALQDQAESVLAEVGEQWRPKGATAVVTDPASGSILALANWPRVNANELGDAPDYARQNRATRATYEPGSTFKPITVAGALEDGKVTPQTELTLPPSIKVADREIGESHPRGWVTLNTGGILQQSSNVGAIMIGQRLGAKRFDHWIRRFGFGKPTGVELPGEESGILLDLDKYSGSSMGNLPIGQGLAVTPMQMATAYGAIANGGILRPPHVVAAIGGRKARAPKGQRVISAATAASVRRMLEGVTGPGGTASGAHIDGYVLAGKTGTAEKPDETGGYSKTKYVASFVGFAPAKKPRLLVTVMVDEPRGEIYGGLIAAPAFRKIMSFALTNLGIPPE